MKKIVPLLLILCLTVMQVPAQSGNLDIYITHLDVKPSDDTVDNKTLYLVNATITVVNHANEPVDYTHSNLCEFTLQIVQSPDGASDYFPYGCAEATKTVSFQPGMTNTSAIGGIVIDQGLEQLPNGNYTVSVNTVSYQDDLINEVHNASFGVVDHKVADTYYTDIQSRQDVEQLTFPISLLPFLLVPILIRKIKS